MQNKLFTILQFLYNTECHFYVDAVLQLENPSSPEGTTRMDIETEKNPSNPRKRRSLNIMLRERGSKRTRPAVEEAREDHNEAHEVEIDAHEDQSDAHEDDNEEAHEDQDEVHDDLDILSSPGSSGADPMVSEATFKSCMYNQ